MQVKQRILRIEFSVHAHATEDVERVKQALLNLLPEHVREKVAFSEAVVEGHYSNPIRRMSVHISGEDAIKVLEYLGSKLDDIEKRALAVSLDLRYDKKEGRLYIRFNKQDAFLGRIKLYDGDDVIRVVVVFRGSPKLEDVKRVLEEVGLLS